MAEIQSVTIFSNGNLMVFDNTGQQVPELQFSFMELIWAEFEKRGVDPTKIPDIKTVVNGRNKFCQPFKIEDQWNTNFVDF